MKKRIAVLALIVCLFISLFPVTVTAESIDVEVNKEAVLSGLFEADISTLREALDAGIVTSREITQYYLDRIEAYDQPYNCFITICADALQQADARDQERAEGKKIGPLHGIPIVVKDNIDVAGVHTTNGHKKQNSQIAKDNAESVQKLIDAGAVILAKANMSKDARSAYWSKSDAAGEVKNAYNPIYSPGGAGRVFCPAFHF
ncbi:MAG: amidase [Ruminococcaceae bacterium]|nr:amidase [Oscillospiraceae bacterium]